MPCCVSDLDARGLHSLDKPHTVVYCSAVNSCNRIDAFLLGTGHKVHFNFKTISLEVILVGAVISTVESQQAAPVSSDCPKTSSVNW